MERELDKIAIFEERMEVIAKDDGELAKACRSVHSALKTAKYVAESIFNDDVADNPEVVMGIHAAIADELDDMKDGDGEDGGSGEFME